MANGFDRFDQEHTSPPIPLVQRTATVQLGSMNTIRYPGDLFERRDSTWFEPGAPIGQPGDSRSPEQPHAVREKNRVRFLRDGPETMSAMENAIDSAQSGDFIYMLNWWGDPALILPSNRRLGDVLSAAFDRGVEIRGIFWKLFSDPLINALTFLATGVPIVALLRWRVPNGTDEQNKAMVDFVNNGTADVHETLFDPNGNPKVTIQHLDPQGNPQPVGGAIHDQRLNRHDIPFSINVGSHHQKILCVKVNGKLTAFCGGIDFNRDRLEFKRLTFGGAPLHDVHCVVQGPAAGDLLATFEARWFDHPDRTSLNGRFQNLNNRKPSDLQPPAEPDGRHIVQMGRTFGDRELFGSNPSNRHYGFAPQGEHTAKRLMLRAIQNARKFIYLEDQYFVSIDASNALRDALNNNNLAHVTIVLPHHEIGDMPLSVKHRRAAIKNLKQQHPDRVRVFYRCPPNGKPGDFHTYVHAKTTIIDDELAIIGSVNYALRSWTHDSEVCLGIYDPSSDQVLTSRFARWLRMRLWAEHLFGIVVPPSPPDQPPALKDSTYAELFDGVAAGSLWVKLIQIKNAFLKKNGLPPTPKPGQGIPLHPRDLGFDQSTDSSEIAQSALVRPYDEDDDPIEIPFAGVPILGPLVNNDALYDEFCDPR